VKHAISCAGTGNPAGKILNAYSLTKCSGDLNTSKVKYENSTATQIAIENNKKRFLLVMERNLRFPLFCCTYLIYKTVTKCFSCGSGFLLFPKLSLFIQCSFNFGKQPKRNHPSSNEDSFKICVAV
jgi:hypothetical protein